jgi:hypothetical protein
MHGLKQSFKHELSFRLTENISKRIGKNAGAATCHQIRRPPKQQGERCNN